MGIRTKWLLWILHLTRKHQALRLWLLFVLGIGWIVLFSLVPLMLTVVCSFLTRGEGGTILPLPTLNNYLRIVSLPLYRKILINSIVIGLETTIVSLLLGYPVGYYLGRKKGRKIWLVALIFVPFWTSYLVRIFAWLLILMDHGVLNWVLLTIKVIQEPVQLLYTHLGVVIGIVYSALPFAILPIFAVINRIDEDLINAAKVLGAKEFGAFWEVTLPLSLPGVFASSILTFIYGAGSFLAPAILGGADVVMISNVIANVFLVLFNWPFAAALTIVFLTMVIAALAFSDKLIPLEKIYAK